MLIPLRGRLRSGGTSWSACSRWTGGTGRRGAGSSWFPAYAGPDAMTAALAQPAATVLVVGDPVEEVDHRIDDHVWALGEEEVPSILQHAVLALRH